MDTFQAAVKYKSGTPRKQMRDRLVLRMVVEGLHLLKALDPRCNLPSRRTLARTLLSEIYDFAFADKDAVRKIEARLVARMSATEEREEEMDVTDSGGQTEEALTRSIWACFDNKFHDYMRAKSRPRGDRPYLQMGRYNEESPLKRDADPLAW
ncbi:hypothetical protein PoB_000870800 [Plakobranchus ocellatus]|uniref:Uncharacterized protein n=1 Tax=Plakobranchus ocellatus TaxID=259542 RepID=A0AAV3YI35_9GAST|nr:hypothetical protein PoB_000870800 [Plakobranchus ocellatus]